MIDLPRQQLEPFLRLALAGDVDQHVDRAEAIAPIVEDRRRKMLKPDHASVGPLGNRLQARDLMRYAQGHRRWEPDFRQGLAVHREELAGYAPAVLPQCRRAAVQIDAG